MFQTVHLAVRFAPSGNKVIQSCLTFIKHITTTRTSLETDSNPGEENLFDMYYIASSLKLFVQ